ncbi:MAG: ABC transporter ATP-binding protein [Tissierella sp.]|nr:ABC transporter ATP-binding protein [Tissierella sp.]
MLTIHNLSKNFGSFTALKDINLEFTNGVYGLLAPNGAGKTTLMKIITTLLYPSGGEVLYEGQDIFKRGEDYRELLGYLPQEFGYYKNYSPMQYLLYIAALKGLEGKVAKERAIELLKLVGLENVMNKKMKKFSGGMIQRVGIAQAMLNNPKILILDEPTAGLDPKERVRFRNLLTDLSREKIVILSTHIVSDVESIANEIIMIKDKEILYKDSMRNICNLIEGMVYETEVAFDEVSSFKQQYQSLSEKQEQGKMKIRFISKDDIPASTWKPVSPSLEDVFLNIYNDEILEGDNQ